MYTFTTIRVNSITKEKLDIIKKKYTFFSFCNAIETMCTFFEINKISPKEGINQGYQNSIFNVEKAVKVGFLELNKQYTKDSQSMRKLMRAIEKDHMINMSTKVSYLYDKSREETVKNTVKNSFNSIVDGSKKDLDKDKEIELLKDIIDEKNDELKKLKYAHDNEGNLASKYEEKLKIIFQQYQLEKTTFGKEKIVIDMSRESFENLFEI